MCGGGLERHQYPSLPRGVSAELGTFEIRVTLEGKSGEQFEVSFGSTQLSF